MSSFWSFWIISLTILSIVGVTWLLFATRKMEQAGGEEGETGHAHEHDDIEELDNPLPAWWFNLFVLTIVFSVIYLLLYPGMGNFPGLLGWTSVGQWQEEVAEAEAEHAERYAALAQVPVTELAKDRAAMNMGRRIFANNCATCHGNNARGAFGFPDLTDGSWQYGGEPEQIRKSIRDGRQGVMPPWGQVLNQQQLLAVTDYVLALAGRGETDEAGASVYSSYCAACHGPSGQGIAALGTPTFEDDIWLYGGQRGQVLHTVKQGRIGIMPPHGDWLTPEQIHLLTAYVWSLSNPR